MAFDSTPRKEADRSSKALVRDEGMHAFTLMNRTHEVFQFCYNDATGLFYDQNRIVDPGRAPLGMVSSNGKKVSTKLLAFWWNYRAIPTIREDIDVKLEQLDLRTPSQIPFRSWGLSLSDQYWIKPFRSPVQWEDINFFYHGFPSSDAASWLDEVGGRSPDNTTDGELPKRWVCERGRGVLLKAGGRLNQEPYNEAVATALYRRLLPEGEYVPYTLRGAGERAVCACENFVSSTEEYVPAYYVRRLVRHPSPRSDYRRYLDCCANLGVANAEEALAKMIVCDDILGNRDRHWRNFGLVRDVETGACRTAPLFDTGNSLWSKVTSEHLATDDYSFTAKPFHTDASRQLRLVRDWSWFDPSALRGFEDEAADILSANPALAGRVDFVRRAVRWHIDRCVKASHG
ncbi:DNA-binding protein [Gordonibacter massiliensis (ex Traore et al. 2017)]|uniref:DNA-binding protein n=1 Tax=Gordonibacter massiliensis (ex Traore et al. 2017) TaxID=1841863 RepID=UPI001C8B600D|nr:DNA-binding protein [Gordonibacter massiliensis (ex Traore et al. 2017)]MBX9032789.1 DNA-binding protein [Gordonibacter massiliensis (ex Traore et al. 2017)]